MSQRGLILLNLGTPRAPDPRSVRDYLREFLMDPYVIDIPFWARAFLVHGLILPRRPKKAAAAYQKIWTDRGSPLAFHLEDLVKQVQEILPSDVWVVEGAMRYGQPSIQSALMRMKEKGVGECRVLPLYPQYSLAATESSLRKTLELAAEILPGVDVQVYDAFFNQPGFIQPFVEVIQKKLDGFHADHFLFSFHGLPERQIRKVVSEGSNCLKKEDCCAQWGDDNRDCYRAQCFETARSLARGLRLEEKDYTVCFQSRLGRTPWIKPYTDHLLRSLPGTKKRVAVVCPAFVADCLETLEEIQIRGRKDFIDAGGEDLILVPSLNSEQSWAQNLADMVARDQIPFRQPLEIQRI